ncbi:serpin-ZX, partial [Trifolium medium]|nr:serpin-ZX [Trifolium medium]
MTLREIEKSSKRRRTILSNDDESITNLTKVSLIIAKHLFSKQKYKENNVVFSPLSLQVVLSIIAAGSKGPTQQQLLKFLRFESMDHLNSFFSNLLSVMLKEATPSRRPCHYFLEEEDQDATVVSITNGVWVEQTISLRPSFKQIVSSKYKATLSSVDFKNK